MSIIPTRASDAGHRAPSARFGVGTMAGIGVVAGLSSAVLALIGQARSATRSIEALAVEAALADGTLVPPAIPGGSRAQQRLADHLVHVRLPQGEGIYLPDGSLQDGSLQDGSSSDGGAPPLTLVMLGDSTSVGYGTRSAEELPGVILARGVAAALNRPVRMRSHGLTGARTSDLPRQLTLCLADEPDIVVILIGGNDMRDMVPPWKSAALLGQAVTTLTSQGIPVVAGCCPDFGVITAIPQPLRSLLSGWSLRLAALQERAVVDAGGAAVALARLVSPQFVGNPEMFARDHFHPSGAGYGRAMAVLLPALIEELQGRRPVPADPGDVSEANRQLSA
jgi:lysophospholipase L1-like esterase